MDQKCSSAARYVNKQSKFALKAPVKPSIKYFLADSPGTPVKIDLSKISTMNTSTDSESEIFHEAIENASSSTRIEPTIKQFQQNSMSIPFFRIIPACLIPWGFNSFKTTTVSKILLQHPTMFTSSVANKEYFFLTSTARSYKCSHLPRQTTNIIISPDLFILLGQYILHAQSTPKA